MKAFRLFGLGVCMTLLPALPAMAIGNAHPAASSQRPVDEFAPAGSLLFFGVNDVGQMIADMESMPLGKILAEEGVRTFLEGPIQMVEGAIREGLSEIKDRTGVDTLDVDRILCRGYRRAFVVLTHVKLPDMQANPLPEIGLVIGIEPVEGTTDVVDVIEQVVRKQVASLEEGGMSDVGLVETRHGETTVLSVQMPGGPPLCFAKVDGMSLIALDSGSLDQVIDLAGGQGASLAGDPVYQGASSRLGAGRSGALTFFVNSPALIDLASEGVKMGLAMSGNETWAGKVDAILAASGLAGAGAVATASISADGVGVQRSYMKIMGEPHGLMKMVECDPIDIGKLSWVPKEALSCTISHIDIKGFYDAMVDVAKAADPSLYQQMIGMIGAVSAQLAGGGQAAADGGYDLANDFLGNLGSEFIMYSVPTQGFMATGEFIMMLETLDQAKVTEGLRMLCQIPGAMLDTPVKLKEVQAEGGTLYSIDMTEANPAFAMIAAQFQPTFAFKNGYLVASTTLHGVKRALSRLSGAADPADTILANEDFKRFFSKVPEGLPLVSLSYSNIKQAFESVYNQLISLTFMPPFSTMLEDLPVDLALLPTSDEISKHLFGSLSFGYRIEGGIMAESYGPFGAELVPVVAGAAGLGAVLGVRLQESGSPMGLGALEESGSAPVTEEAPEERVATDFGNLKAGILVYKLDQGKLPDTIEDLLKASETYPGGYLPDTKLPMDPWNNGYRYEKIGRDDYRLWSMGPNGKDEGGNGDDLAVGS